MHFLVKFFIKLIIVIVILYKAFFLILDYIEFLEEKGLISPLKKKKKVPQYYDIKPRDINYDEPQSFLPPEFEQWREDYIKKYNILFWYKHTSTL